MKWLCGVSIALALSPLLQAGSLSDRVQYVGGTVAELPGKSSGRIQITDREAFILESHGVTVRVPYSNINNLEYGQRVDRRYLEAILISPLFFLAKKRTNFLTVGYSDAAGKQQAMVFEVGKDEVRSMLVTLAAGTGRKVEFQDEEAREAALGSFLPCPLPGVCDRTESRTFFVCSRPSGSSSISSAAARQPHKSATWSSPACHPRDCLS